MERPGNRRRRVHLVVLSLVAGGMFIVASPSSKAFHESTIVSNLTTLAGVCPPPDQDSRQSADGARSFDDEVFSDDGAMHAEAAQDTRISGTTEFITVQSKGSSIVRGSTSGGGSCFAASRANNNLNVSIPDEGEGPYNYRLAGVITTTGTGFRSNVSGSGCASISFDTFSDSACSPPDRSDPARISFSRTGTTDDPRSLSLGSGMSVGINPSGGSGNASMRWDLTLTITRGPQTVDCGEPITRSVVLTTDLFCTGDGLIVAFPNITIDLGGHRIVGNDTGVGVSNPDGHDGVTVKNGQISDFNVGVLFPFADRTKLSGLLVSGNVNDGVALDHSLSSTVKNVTSRDNGSDGFELNCGQCLVKDNLAESNARGIALAGGDAALKSNQLVGNRSQLNTGDGISIGGFSKLNVLDGNKVESNDGTGIVIATDENVLKRNSVKLNDLDGIRLTNAINNRLTDNLSKGNLGNGFAINGGSDPFPNNVLKENRSKENRGNGFDIGLSTNNHLKSNLSRQNQLGGFRISVSSGNKLEGNTAKLNQAISGPFSGEGIILIESFANTLTGNLVRGNQMDGINLKDSDNNFVTGNTVKLNRLDGIDVDPDSSVNDLSNNVSNENQGFGLAIFNDTAIGTNNRANNNGLGDCLVPLSASVQCT